METLSLGDTPRKSSFAPVCRSDARLLVLGSLPGEASLAAARYYAHPQNHFWRLMGAVTGVPLAEMDYEARLAALYEVLNLANDAVWDGGFTFWAPQRLMVWRYGLVLAGEMVASPEQIDHMIRSALDGCERFYPAFQLACWGDAAPQAAMEAALAEAYGRA